MRLYSTFRWLAASALSLSACASPLHEEEVPPPPLLSTPLTVDNGTDLNGTDLNGTDLNGTDLSQFLVSVNYNPTVRGGSLLDDVWLEGTTFRGYKGSSFFQGEEFVGATFQGNLGGGGTVSVRITGMNPAPAPNEDINLYSLEHLAADGTWKPVCRDASGAPVQALPVEGVWDYRQGVEGGGSKSADPERFTFACLGGAIAKCTLWGYRPWGHHNGVPLASYHQTCTRMVRADYCGTGTSYTQEGSRINFYDTLGIQQDTEDWVFEAEWDEGGARCFHLLNRSHANIPCYELRLTDFCGTDLSQSRGVLMANETPSAGLL